MTEWNVYCHEFGNTGRLLYMVRMLIIESELITYSVY